jgi:pSer/pThr/pTyr-binding forkhead associated (FHA) protein/adenosine deaminase/ppGpp synthetase/RelA/SpoT-type nucleotidyltranferase/serine/threonine protein phosphatase PrpC
MRDHRSPTGSAEYAAEEEAITQHELASHQTTASLRSLINERLRPGLALSSGAAATEDELRLARAYFFATAELGESHGLSSALYDVYRGVISPDGQTLETLEPDFTRSEYYTAFDLGRPSATGSRPEFPEGHPCAEVWRLFNSHTAGESLNDTDRNRLIHELQQMEASYGEGTRARTFMQPSEIGNLDMLFQNIEAHLRDDRHFTADDLANLGTGLHRLGARLQLGSLETARGLTARGRLETMWNVFLDYRAVGLNDAASDYLDQIRTEAGINRRPADRTGPLTDADRHAILLRLCEAQTSLMGRSDRAVANLSWLMGNLGDEIRRLRGEGTEASRFASLTLTNQYIRFYGVLGASRSQAALIESPLHLMGGNRPADGPALIQELEDLAHNTLDPSERLARLATVAQTYALLGQTEIAGNLLDQVEGALRDSPGGNDLAARGYLIRAFGEVHLGGLLETRMTAWIESDRTALGEVQGRGAQARSRLEMIQNWASMASGFNEMGAGALGDRVLQECLTETRQYSPRERIGIYGALIESMPTASRREILNEIEDLYLASQNHEEGAVVLTSEETLSALNLLLLHDDTPDAVHSRLLELQSFINGHDLTASVRLQATQLAYTSANRLDHLLLTRVRELEAAGQSEGADALRGYWQNDTMGRDRTVDGLRFWAYNAFHDARIEMRAQALTLPPAERLSALRTLMRTYREAFPEIERGRGLTEEFNTEYREFLASLPPGLRSEGLADAIRLYGVHTQFIEPLFSMISSTLDEIPAGAERRSAIMRLAPAISEVRERIQTQWRAVDRRIWEVRTSDSFDYAANRLHGYDAESLVSSADRQGAANLQATLSRFREVETSMWRHFPEGAEDPALAPALRTFSEAMISMAEGHEGEARTSLRRFNEDSDLQAFLRRSTTGDPAAFQAQSQLTALMEMSTNILMGESTARYTRTLRVIQGLASMRVATLQAQGESTMDIEAIRRMTWELPRFLSTLPMESVPEHLDAQLDLYRRSSPEAAQIVSQFEGALSRLPLQHTGEDGTRIGSVWEMVRAIENVREPGGARRAFTALQAVLTDDTDWDWLSREGRGDLGPALQDICDIILDEGDGVDAIRGDLMRFRARIPSEEEEGTFFRETVNMRTALQIGLMVAAGYLSMGAGTLVAESLFGGLATRGALFASRFMATAEIIEGEAVFTETFASVAIRGISAAPQYFMRHLISGIVFNLVHGAGNLAIDSLSGRPGTMENPFSSGVRMAGDSVINDIITGGNVISRIPVPGGMVGRLLFNSVVFALTFQVSQNIRYHAERSVRELAGSEFASAVAREHAARRMYDATGDLFYLRQAEAAQHQIDEIVGHAPDNSGYALLQNMFMNVGQNLAEHHLGIHRLDEHVSAPDTEAVRAAQREQALALARSMAHVDRRALEHVTPETLSLSSDPTIRFLGDLVEQGHFDQFHPEFLTHVLNYTPDPATLPVGSEAHRTYLGHLLSTVNPEHLRLHGVEGLRTAQAMADQLIPPENGVRNPANRRLIDHLLRVIDPVAMRNPARRAELVREISEARRTLEENPQALGGVSVSDGLVLLLSRDSHASLAESARRLASGDLVLRPRRRDEPLRTRETMGEGSPDLQIVADAIPSTEVLRRTQEWVDLYSHPELQSAMVQMERTLVGRDGRPTGMGAEAQAAHQALRALPVLTQRMQELTEHLNAPVVSDANRARLSRELSEVRGQMGQHRQALERYAESYRRFAEAREEISRTIERQTAADRAQAREDSASETEIPSATETEASSPLSPNRGEAEVSTPAHVSRPEDLAHGPSASPIAARMTETVSTPTTETDEVGEVIPFRLRAQRLREAAAGQAHRIVASAAAVLGFVTVAGSAHAQEAPGTHAPMEATVEPTAHLLATATQWLTHVQPETVVVTLTTLVMGFGAIHLLRQLRSPGRGRETGREITEERSQTSALRSEAETSGQPGGESSGEGGREESGETETTPNLLFQAIEEAFPNLNEAHRRVLRESVEKGEIRNLAEARFLIETALSSSRREARPSEEVPPTETTQVDHVEEATEEMSVEADVAAFARSDEATERPVAPRPEDLVAGAVLGDMNSRARRIVEQMGLALDSSEALRTVERLVQRWSGLPRSGAEAWFRDATSLREAAREGRLRIGQNGEIILQERAPSRSEERTARAKRPRDEAAPRSETTEPTQPGKILPGRPLGEREAPSAEGLLQQRNRLMEDFAGLLRLRRPTGESAELGALYNRLQRLVMEATLLSLQLRSADRADAAARELNGILEELRGAIRQVEQTQKDQDQRGLVSDMNTFVEPFLFQMIETLRPHSPGTDAADQPRGLPGAEHVPALGEIPVVDVLFDHPTPVDERSSTEASTENYGVRIVVRHAEDQARMVRLIQAQYPELVASLSHSEHRLRIRSHGRTFEVRVELPVTPSRDAVHPEHAFREAVRRRSSEIALEEGLLPGTPGFLERVQSIERRWNDWGEGSLLGFAWLRNARERLGAFWREGFSEEVHHLSESDTPFAPHAARAREALDRIPRLLAERLLRLTGRAEIDSTSPQAREIQERIRQLDTQIAQEIQVLQNYRDHRLILSRDLVSGHSRALTDVLEHLRSLARNPELHLATDIPPHGGLKDPADVASKLTRRGWRSLEPFTDMGRARVVVENYDDVTPVIAAIQERFSVRPEYTGEGAIRLQVKSDDGSSAALEEVPDRNTLGRLIEGSRSGYRAIHVVVEVDGRAIEVQIQTRALYEWGQIQHDFYKGRGLAPETQRAVNDYFRAAAGHLSDIELGASAGPLPLPAASIANVPHVGRLVELLRETRARHGLPEGEAQGFSGESGGRGGEGSRDQTGDSPNEETPGSRSEESTAVTRPGRGSSTMSPAEATRRVAYPLDENGKVMTRRTPRGEEVVMDQAGNEVTRHQFQPEPLSPEQQEQSTQVRDMREVMTPLGPQAVRRRSLEEPTRVSEAPVTGKRSERAQSFAPQAPEHARRTLMEIPGVRTAIDRLVAGFPSLRETLNQLIQQQNLKTNRISFLAPNEEHLERVLGNTQRLLNNPQFREALQERFGPHYQRVVEMAALLSKIGFGHDELDPRDNRSYGRNRIFAMEILDRHLRSSLMDALGLDETQYALFREAILREGTFGMGTRDNPREVELALAEGAKRQIDLRSIFYGPEGRFRGKYDNPLTALLTIAAEADVSSRRLQNWQRSQTLMRALIRISSDPIVQEYYIQRSFREIQRNSLAGETPAFVEGVRSHTEQFNQRLREVIRREVFVRDNEFLGELTEELELQYTAEWQRAGYLREDAVRQARQQAAEAAEEFHSEIWRSLGSIDSESYLWFLGSHGVRDIEINDQGEIVIVTLEDLYPRLGAAAGLPHVREFHQSRLRDILWQINRAQGTELTLIGRDSRERPELYQELRARPKAETHTHLKMAVDFDLYIWNGTILSHDTQAFENFISSSDRLLTDLWMRRQGEGARTDAMGERERSEGIFALRDVFRIARETSRDLHDFVSRRREGRGESRREYSEIKNKDRIIEDARSELTRREEDLHERLRETGHTPETERLVDEIETARRQIELYERLKFYVKNLFNFQEGALTEFVPHFMAASHLLKISHADELATLKRITREVLTRYQADNVSYFEPRFNIGKERGTREEVLTVIQAYEEWRAAELRRNPEALIPEMRIILSITKFADPPQRPHEERVRHKTESARAIVSILEEAGRRVESSDHPDAPYEDFALNRAATNSDGDPTFQVRPSHVLRYLAGIDAAGQEEHNPPSLFFEAFREIERYNARVRGEGRPERAIGATFHVSESNTDVSPESALRYTLDAMFMRPFSAVTGDVPPIMNRLGHAIVPGISHFGSLRGTRSAERVSERIRQIDHDLSLLELGLPLTSVNPEGLRREREELLARFPTPEEQERNEIQTPEYDPERIRDLELRAAFVRDQMIQRGIVVETNPTSNLGISPYITGYQNHTLRTYLSYQHGDWARTLVESLGSRERSPQEQRTYEQAQAYLARPETQVFQGRKVRVTINTDDLTLFGTNMTEEFYRVGVSLDLPPEELRRIIDEGFASPIRPGTFVPSQVAEVGTASHDTVQNLSGETMESSPEERGEDRQPGGHGSEGEPPPTISEPEKAASVVDLASRRRATPPPPQEIAVAADVRDEVSERQEIPVEAVGPVLTELANNVLEIFPQDSDEAPSDLIRNYAEQRGLIRGGQANREALLQEMQRMTDEVRELARWSGELVPGDPRTFRRPDRRSGTQAIVQTALLRYLLRRGLPSQSIESLENPGSLMARIRNRIRLSTSAREADRIVEEVLNPAFEAGEVSPDSVEMEEVLDFPIAADVHDAAVPEHETSPLNLEASTPSVVPLGTPAGVPSLRALRFQDPGRRLAAARALVSQHESVRRVGGLYDQAQDTPEIRAARAYLEAVERSEAPPTDLSFLDLLENYQYAVVSDGGARRGGVLRFAEHEFTPPEGYQLFRVESTSTSTSGHQLLVLTDSAGTSHRMRGMGSHPHPFEAGDEVLLFLTRRDGEPEPSSPDRGGPSPSPETGTATASESSNLTAAFARSEDFVPDRVSSSSGEASSPEGENHVHRDADRPPPLQSGETPAVVVPTLPPHGRLPTMDEIHQPMEQMIQDREQAMADLQAVADSLQTRYPEVAERIREDRRRLASAFNTAEETQVLNDRIRQIFNLRDSVSSENFLERVADLYLGRQQSGTWRPPRRPARPAEPAPLALDTADAASPELRSPPQGPRGGTSTPSGALFATGIGAFAFLEGVPLPLRILAGVLGVTTPMMASSNLPENVANLGRQAIEGIRSLFGDRPSESSGAVSPSQAAVHSTGSFEIPPVRVLVPSGVTRFVIGRSPESHLRIDHANISRVHAVLERGTDGNWMITDHSSNGIFYDQQQTQRLPRRQAVPIPEAARFTINGQTFEFHAPAPLPAVPEVSGVPQAVVVRPGVLSLPVQFDSNGVFALTKGNFPAEAGLQHFRVEFHAREGNQWYLLGRSSPETVSFFNPQTGQFESIHPDSFYPITAGSRFLLGDPTNPTRRWVVSVGRDGTLAILRPQEAASPVIAPARPAEPVSPVAPNPQVRSVAEDLQRSHPVFEGAKAEVHLETSGLPLRRNARGEMEIDLEALGILAPGQADQAWRAPAVEDRGGAAGVAHQGVRKYNHNEDRFVIVSCPNGRSVMVVIDGVGGHGGGERAADLVRRVTERALRAGRSPEEAIALAHRGMRQDNLRFITPIIEHFMERENLNYAQALEKAQRKADQLPDAVMMAVDLTPQPDGTYRPRFLNCGDCEGVVLDLTAPDPILHTTARPNLISQLRAQAEGRPYQLTPDGRLARGQTLQFRTDPNAFMVTETVGSNAHADISEPVAGARPGALIIGGSDGMESFGNYDILVEAIRRSGANPESASQVTGAIMEEILLRQHLLNLVKTRRGPVVLDAQAYREAYAAAHSGREPTLSGMYDATSVRQVRRDSEGRIRRGPDGLPLYDEFVGPFTVSADSIVRDAQGRPVDHFKFDNVSVVVQVVGQPVIEEPAVRVIRRRIKSVGQSETAPPLPADQGVPPPQVNLPPAPPPASQSRSVPPPVPPQAARPRDLAFPRARVGATFSQGLRHASHPVSIEGDLFSLLRVAPRGTPVFLAERGGRLVAENRESDQSLIGLWQDPRGRLRVRPARGMGSEVQVMHLGSYRTETAVGHSGVVLSEVADVGFGNYHLRFNLASARSIPAGDGLLPRDIYRSESGEIPLRRLMGGVGEVRIYVGSAEGHPESPGPGIATVTLPDLATIVGESQTRSAAPRERARLLRSEEGWHIQAVGEVRVLRTGSLGIAEHPLSNEEIFDLESGDVISFDGTEYRLDGNRLIPEMTGHFESTRISAPEPVGELPAAAEVPGVSAEERVSVSQQRRPRLVLSDGRNLELFFDSRGWVRLGRGPFSQEGFLALTNDGRISECQATILYRDGQYFIADGGEANGWKSRNGTSINGEALQSGSRPRPLRPGDRITLGPSLLEIQWFPPEAAPPPFLMKTVGLIDYRRGDPVLQQGRRIHQLHRIEGALLDGLEIPGRRAVWDHVHGRISDAADETGGREWIVWDRARDREVSTFLSEVEQQARAALGGRVLIQDQNPYFEHDLQTVLQIYGQALVQRYRTSPLSGTAAEQASHAFARQFDGKAVLLGDILRPRDAQGRPIQGFPVCRHLTLLTQAFLVDMGLREAAIQRGAAGGPHVWNEVMVGGRRRVIEPTWFFYGNHPLLQNEQDSLRYYMPELRPGVVRE